jgi:hypothetical protein
MKSGDRRADCRKEVWEYGEGEIPGGIGERLVLFNLMRESAPWLVLWLFGRVNVVALWGDEEGISSLRRWRWRMSDGALQIFPLGLTLTYVFECINVLITFKHKFIAFL